MHARLRPNRFSRFFMTAGLFTILGGALYAHTYVGSAHPSLARARVESPNASQVDMPEPIPGTNLSIVCFKVRNTSPFDARITSIGFDLPGTPTGFTLIESGGFDFELIEQVSNVPEVPDVTLDFALVTGATFGGGRPRAGLPPSSTPTTFCVSGPFSQTTPIERVLDRGLLRFQQVGVDGEEGDIAAVWANWTGQSGLRASSPRRR
jgi:hypothetical protein